MVDNSSPGDRAWAEGIGIFAGVMLATLGLFQFLEGLTAVAEDDIFVRTSNYLFDVDVTAWGWVHMLIGAAAVVIGVCLLLGQYWAMIGGICVAVLSALASFTFLPFYPFWSLAIIAFALAVIWAMTVMMGERR